MLQTAQNYHNENIFFGHLEQDIDHNSWAKMPTSFPSEQQKRTSGIHLPKEFQLELVAHFKGGYLTSRGSCAFLGFQTDLQSHEMVDFSQPWKCGEAGHALNLPYTLQSRFSFDFQYYLDHIDTGRDSNVHLFVLVQLNSSGPGRDYILAQDIQHLMTLCSYSPILQPGSRKDCTK